MVNCIKKVLLVALSGIALLAGAIPAAWASSDGKLSHASSSVSTRLAFTIPEKVYVNSSSSEDSAISSLSADTNFCHWQDGRNLVIGYQAAGTEESKSWSVVTDCSMKVDALQVAPSELTTMISNGSLESLVVEVSPST